MTIKTKAFLYTLGLICFYSIISAINFFTIQLMNQILSIPAVYVFGVLYSTKSPLSYFYLLIGLVVLFIPIYLIIYIILKRKINSSTQAES